MSHELRINLIAVGGLYEARCSCGWRGEPRAYEADAQDDAAIHRNDGSTP